MAHLADESGRAGLPGQQVGEVREEVSSDQPRTPGQGCGAGSHFLLPSLLGRLWDFHFKQRCELALSP